LSWIPETTGPIIVHDENDHEEKEVKKNGTVPQEEGYLGVPTSIVASGSSDTLIGSIREY
jgi:hypothetical protein